MSRQMDEVRTVDFTPARGGKTDTIGATGERLITVPDGVRGILVSCDNPIRLAFGTSAALTLNDANYGYYRAGSFGPFYVPQSAYRTAGGVWDMNVHWSPTTAVATVITL